MASRGAWWLTNAGGYTRRFGCCVGAVSFGGEKDLRRLDPEGEVGPLRVGTLEEHEEGLVEDEPMGRRRDGGTTEADVGLRAQAHAFLSSWQRMFWMAVRISMSFPTLGLATLSFWP